MMHPNLKKALMAVESGINSNDFMSSVVIAASEYWERANCLGDFCIQHVGAGESIVFGGSNRVVWTIRSGFIIDRSYCSSSFLTANFDIE